jgi:hypothetical protein
LNIRCHAGLMCTLENTMNKLAIALVGASALFGTAAVAAPLTPAVSGMTPESNIENVRMVCNESGRCWRERGERRVIIRDSYNDSYNYAPRERYIERRGYYDDGPRVGVGFGAPGVSVGVGVGSDRW